MDRGYLVRNGIRAVAIGSFDGMHIAHKNLIDRVDEVVVIEHGRAVLTPGYKRTLFCEKPCAFYLLEKIKGFSCSEFIDLLSRNYPELERIVIGYDFRFGKDKKGSPESIKKLFAGQVETVPEIRYGETAVHSGVIKDHIRDGDVVSAGKLLGRCYEMEGRVVSGQGIGSSDLVPTLNMRSEDYIVPKEGVYAGRTRIRNDIWMPSVVFVGHRLSTDGSFAVESHILDNSIMAKPGDETAVVFIEHIRDNTLFSRLSDLKKQIYADIERARSILFDQDHI